MAGSLSVDFLPFGRKSPSLSVSNNNINKSNVHSTGSVWKAALYYRKRRNNIGGTLNLAVW